MEKLISFCGLIILVFISYLLSSNRKKINWRTVISGVILQIFLGLIILKTDLGQQLFHQANNFFVSILNYTNVGSNFVFGSLSKPTKVGFVFATMILPTIIFVSSLMSILYHFGVMQFIIKWTAKVMVKTMGTSGAESLAAAANIFAGQTEAPLVIKPYIDKMSNSELLALMTGGMATVAGGVLATYVGFGIDAGHLLAASVMSAPAALVCSKLLIPETNNLKKVGDVEIISNDNYANAIDAAATGAGDGLKLALNVGAMLLAFIALIAMFNGILSFLGSLFNYPKLSFELISGILLSPVAFIMGVPWSDASEVGSLLGKKLVLNEFIAYYDLKEMIVNKTISERSIGIATYALCGFANFGSIAIQIGGIGTIAPKRKHDIAKLGIKSLIGGTIACLMTACIAGMLL
jgi:CNT family concentrative nucleoside transporter